MILLFLFTIHSLRCFFNLSNLILSNFLFFFLIFSLLLLKASSRFPTRSNKSLGFSFDFFCCVCSCFFLLILLLLTLWFSLMMMILLLSWLVIFIFNDKRHWIPSHKRIKCCFVVIIFKRWMLILPKSILLIKFYFILKLLKSVILCTFPKYCC